VGDKQRISYVPLDQMDDEMRAEMERCQREGTPRPESSAIRAHVPAMAATKESGQHWAKH
jgi:hypothetical protein